MWIREWLEHLLREPIDSDTQTRFNSRSSSNRSSTGLGCANNNEIKSRESIFGQFAVAFQYFPQPQGSMTTNPVSLFRVVIKFQRSVTWHQHQHVSPSPNRLQTSRKHNLQPADDKPELILSPCFLCATSLCSPPSPPCVGYRYRRRIKAYLSRP